MNTRLEIILNVQGTNFYLDTQGIDTIPLTFNIANIKDISTTQGSFSKSIVVPETPNNRKVFNNISDLNSESTFDPNLRNRAYILVDSQMVIDGYFQLTDISIDRNTHKNSLTLVVFTDNNDFYTLLAEDYIDTLNLSRYDHIWNETNIISSWSKDYRNGYYYPLIDYGQDWSINSINGTNIVTSSSSTITSGVVQTKDMFPSLYARTIWDQIFYEAGFNWTSNSLTTQTPFDNLVVPFNSQVIPHDDEFINARVFRVALASDQNIKIGTNYTFYPFVPTTATPYYVQPPVSNTSPGDLVLTVPYRVKFTDETSPNGDPNGVWNTTLWEYTNTTTTPISEKFGFDMTIEQIFYYSKARTPQLQLKRSRNPVTGATVSGGFDVITDISLPATTYSSVSGGNGWSIVTSAAFGKLDQLEKVKRQWYSENLQIAPGEKVWLEYSYKYGGKGDYDTQVYFYNIVNNTHTVAKIKTGSYIFNEILNSMGVGEILNISEAIPKKIKKRDFILSIIKMFNLVVEPSKTDPKTLVVETRDYYYSSGKIKDWSKKIDLNDTIDVQILGEQQNKRTILTYKPDKDYLNTDYTSRVNRTYGEYQYDTTNEFVNGDKKLEVIFSPTPITTLKPFVSTGLVSVVGATLSSLVIPKIAVVNNNVVSYFTGNIRILQKKYITGLPSSDKWMLNATTLTSYPYAGHFNDPHNPTSDINFGQTTGLYFPQGVVTNNTLYTKYWKKMLDEISDIDSRIITASFYLTPEDIVDFKFNHNIFLDFGDGGQYYKVNKIDGYDPTTIKTCRIELIKTKDITVHTAPKDVRPKPKEKPFYHPIIHDWRDNHIFGPEVILKGIGNIVAKSEVFIKGNFNNVNEKSFISGDNNNIQSIKATIIGDKNTTPLNSDKALIIGDTNNIVEGTQNVKIIGNDNISNVSNTIIIGDGLTSYTEGSTNIGGILILENNYTTGGRDEILSPFSENSIINYINGGRDEVRELGSYTNINIISAGRNVVL